MTGIVTLDLLNDAVDALVRAGKYPSGEEAVRHALDALLTANPELRARTAVESFAGGKVTLARAAEIVGLDQESSKGRLAERSIPIVADETPEEIEAGAEVVRRLRERP